MIRANRVIRAIEIGVSIANDSRESRCEAPVPLRCTLERNLNSMPNMTGQTGYWTLEMNGGSSAPYLTRTPCVPLFQKLSEIDFQICDKLATILRTLPLMYEMKYRQFCANLARNLRQICATPRSRTPPSRDF